MTLDDFIKLYSGLYVDFDGAYPTQCMDLMHLYVYIVLGITDKKVLSASTAEQAYTNKYPKLFQKVDNLPNNSPVKGDIVFWGKAVGQSGHVAIITSANISSFESFDANWPAGSTPHIQKHDYVGVLGWLHPLDDGNWKKKYEDKVAELVTATNLNKVGQEKISVLENELKKLKEAIGHNQTPLSEYDFKDLLREVFIRLKLVKE